MIEDAKPCPKCGTLIEPRPFPPGEPPVGPGDWVVCAFCDSVLRFGAGMQLRLATAAETAEIVRKQPGDLLAAAMSCRIIEREELVKD
jgi:hypothetical protein